MELKPDQTKSNVKDLVSKIWHGIKERFGPPAPPETEKIIDEVGKALRDFSKMVPLPVNLQLSAGGKDYVTYRRIDGEQLYRNSQIKPDSLPKIDFINGRFSLSPFGRIQINKRVFSIPVNSISEDQVVVFALPRDYDCKNTAKKKNIATAVKSRYDSLLWDDMFRENPALYSQDDWDVSWQGIVVAVRRGNSIYRGEVVFDGVVGFKEALQDGDGNAELSNVYLDHTNKDAAEAHYIEKYAKQYILVGGTTEKEKKPREQKLPVLKPVKETN